MIFSHWYFCHTLKMTPQDTGSYLEFLFQMEEETASITEKNEALAWLEKQEDSLLQAYAVPSLISGLLTGNSREQPVQKGKEWEWRIYMLKSKKLVSSLLETGPQESLAKDCLNLIQSLDEAEYKGLVDKVLEIPFAEQDHEYQFSYLESDECVYPVILLSILCAVAKEDPKMVSEAIAEKKPKFLDAALDMENGLGRLPWKLALDLQCYCGMTFDDALKYFPEYWMDSPECLEIAAHIMLEDFKTSEKTSRDVSGRLIEESYKLDFFCRWRNRIPEAVWIDEKADYPNRFKICAALWQNILWNTAFEYDGTACKKQLQKLWNAPVYVQTKQTGTDKSWRHILIPNGACVPNLEHYPDYLVCTPWQRRTIVKKGSKNANKPFREFTDMIRNATALRVFAAAVMLRKMIERKQFPIEYCRVLLNMGDIFQSETVSSELSGEARYWESAVIRLGYFAKNCICMLGRGDLNSKIPMKMITAIKEGRENPKKNEQLNLQYQVTGIPVCIHWAVESLRAGSIRQDGLIESPWFYGSQESGAAQLCRYFFHNGIHQADYDYREPVLLFFQAFPEEYRQVIISSDADSWIVKYNRDQERITLCDVMLSSDLLLEDWESLGELRKERFEKDTWLSVLTIRLHCLLSGSISGHENWYTEWRDGIAAFISEQDAYGALFYQMADLLAIKFSESNIPQYYPEIIKLVIGTLHNYTSEETIFYQYVLTERLIYAAEYFGTMTAAASIGQNLIELYSKRDLPKEQDLLEYSLAQLKKALPSEVLRKVRHILQNHWKQQCASRDHHALIHLDKADWNPLTDFALQKNYTQLSVMRHMQNTEQAHRKKTEDLFKNPEGAESNGWYVGIITNEKEPWDRKPETTYLIQYGTGKREPCISKAFYRKGEVVGVYLNNQNIQKIGKLAWKDDGKHVSVKLKELSAEKIQLCLPNGDYDCITEQMRGREFHALLSLWEPDTSRILQMAPANNSDRQSELEREVYYDEASDFYIPVKRDFNRLVIERFFSQEQSELQLRMVFIHELIQNGQRGFLFSADTGINYLLQEDNWESDSFDRLENKMAEGNYRQGLIIMTTLIEKNGRFVLALSGESPFEEKNWRWESCFSEEEYFVIKRENSERVSKWYADVNIPEMPERVTVILTGLQNMSNQAVCNVQLGQDGWNVRNQRHGIVVAEMLRFKKLKKQWRTPEGFNQLYDLKEGDILKLENSWLRKQREGYHPMMTESALPVFCAAESLSLESENLDTAMISDRVCAVELITSREADPEPYYEAVDIPALDECQYQAEGLVSLFTEELNTASEETKKISLEVWLNLGEKIVPVTVPVTAFQSRPRALGAPVRAVRQEDGKWLFHATVRKIQVRALWEVKECKADRNGEITGIRLGKNMNIPGYGWRCVTQAKERPVLYLWEENSIQKGEENSICGIESGMGKVSKIKRRNFPWEVFPYARHKDMVRLLATSGREFFGDSGWGEFDDTASASDWTVSAGVYLFKEHNGIRYYDLRRSFYIRHAKTDAASASEEQNKRLDEQYEKWIEEGDYHVIGASLGKHAIKLENLKVPQIIGLETIRDKWTDQVLFVEDDHPWVLGRYYPENRIRALLLKKDDAWAASCHEAEPFHVDDELAREFNIASGDTVRKELYYAGLDEDNRLRFEWGHGFTFLVSEEDILDEDGNKIGNNLFYGDMIKYFTMLNDGGEYGWRICVEYRAIIRQIEGRVWNDGFSGNPIIQLLQIRRDLEKEHIFVEKVSAADRTIRQEAGLFNSWGFYDIHNARLEKESIDTLLGEEGYEKDTKIIFAQLKPEKDVRRVTCLTFTYIPLDGKQGDTWLLEGQTVCMVAGEIVPTGTRQTSRLSNDYRISLYLPHELPHEKNNPQMCVNVLRREFSVDESKLRTLYPDNAKKYYGCKMLVYLKALNGVNHGTNEWLGNIINTPKRTSESLREWVMSQGYGLVTLGMEKNKPLAEVAPGIIGALPPNAVQESVSQGTLAALWLEGEVLKAKTVLPGDMEYLPQSGRPAELLIMDGTAKNYVRLRQAELKPDSLSKAEWQKADDELDRHHFTIAGLPQLLLSDRNLLEKKISEPIPRLAYLIKEQNSAAEQNLEIHVQDEKKFYAARLSLNEQNIPELHYFYPDEQVKKTEWESISFLDGTISELAEFVHRGCWHYHDRNTAFYDQETHQLHVIQLPDGKKYSEIVLFPDNRGKLRYRKEEFLKYGFSAREIIENGLPEQMGQYPVAGVTKNSIWIEIFPGKLLEIPVEYLFAGEKKLPLTGMWVRMLSEGDRVCLWQDNGFAGNQRKLILENIIFGSRAGFGDKNTIFPVKECLEDGLVLGTDLWPVTLPVNGKKWSGQKSVCISRNNTLSPLRISQKLLAGDVLLVNCYKHFLSVTGWDSLKLKTAKRCLWKNTEWLLDDLLSRSGKMWMRECELTLPMQVNNTNTDNGELCAWVFYEQPDMDSLPPGTILCGICAGLRQNKTGQNETTDIIVRTGRALLSIPASHILPGLDRKKTAAAVKLLRRKRMSFWMHKEEDGWYSGLQHGQHKEQSEIRMLFYEEDAEGILCLSLDTLALRWLPAENASRAGRKIAGSILWKVLSERPDRLAKHLDQGTLSLTKTWQNEQKYEVLKADGTRYRATPMEKVATDEKGVHCYLAELYPYGDIICLYSETEYNCTSREPIPIEIANKQTGRITAYPYGMRRKALHLTPWVYKAFSAASVSDSSERFEELNLHQFRDEIPECFDKYRQLPEQADHDSEMGQLDYELLQDHERTQEQLIYLYELISKKRDGKLNFNEINEFIRLTLKAWFEEQGKYLVSGLDPRQQTIHTKQIDAAPAIAAVLLLNSIKGRPGDDRLQKAARPLAVHLARMLGISCGSSIHQEILLEHWILGNEKTAGLWLRLKQLSLRGEDISGQASAVFDGQLTPNQVRQLYNICHSLMMNTFWDQELELVAESILLCIGGLEECDKFYKSMQRKYYITEKMSILGRILTPIAGIDIPGNNLSSDDFRFLRTLLRRLLQKNSVPLSLVTDTQIPLSNMEKQKGISLCDEFCRLVRFPERKYASNQRKYK